LNETGDIKLEANAEYRFKLFWILEGATFLDAGNIWSYNYDPARPDHNSDFSNFIKILLLGQEPDSDSILNLLLHELILG
jgi:outer membrane protein assembly factor BamA